jgi:glycosyltransferase involved in cell wall biosynthesis
VSLVVATRNQREQVAILVRRVARALGRVHYEILFVDDSDDDTPEQIAREMAADPCVRMLHREAETDDGGQADAVVTGIRQTRGVYIGVLDADLRHPPETLISMLAAAEDADLVVASRYIPGAESKAADRLARRLRARSEALAAAALFRRVRACTDPLSGFFLFRREVVEGVALRPMDGTLLLELLARGRWKRLTEVPYQYDGRVRKGESSVHTQTPAAYPVYLAYLRDLRLHGHHERGAIRYRRLRAPTGPDDPQPLDDDLPDAPEVAGPRRRRLLWTIGLLALALRLILLPLGHWWDLTVDYNVFIDLAHNHSPYETMRYLSHIAQAAGWDTNYEYYAYPPAPLYIYYPLARLFALLHPHATYYFPVSGSFAMPRLPLDFYFLYKLPIWAADFLLAALLARMSGTIRGFRDYLLNPYILLVSTWTFDSIMALGLVLGVYYLQRGKFARSGLALAFGTMVKFIPAIAVPTFALYLVKKKRRPGEIALFLGAYLAACVVLLGPFAQGVGDVLAFHGARPGGGMNWEMYWRLWVLFPSGTRLDPIANAIGAFGTPMLIIALLLAYWYTFTSPMRFNRMIIVTLLAFFLGSKLVNEQYALVLFPFAFIEARQVGGAWRWFARLFWIVPLAYAIMRVPIDRFFWLFYHTVFGPRADAIAVTHLTGFESPFIPWQNLTLDQIAVLLLGLAFYALSAVAILWPVRPPRRLPHHEQVVPPEQPAESPAPALPLRSSGDTSPQSHLLLPT